jgi:GxxExxY protein
LIAAPTGALADEGDDLEINDVTGAVIGAAVDVHKALGPGLFESVYEECLCHELSLRKVAFDRQPALPVMYKGAKLECGFRPDLVVEDSVVVEIKAVEDLLPIHDAQLLTYLRLGRWNVGLLMNFNVAVLKNGIKRRVLDLKE